MNSIRTQLSASDVAAQIRLERAVHSGSFLLVEGASDSRLFKAFVDQDSCSVTVCHGRENVMSVVSILERENFCGVLAVADSDFSPLTGEVIESENICLTDHNDLECMIITSSSWDAILSEYGSENKISQFEQSSDQSARQSILKQAAFIGATRFISKKNVWNLKFDRMTYQFRSNKSFEVDQERTVEHIISRSELDFRLESDNLIKMANSELGAGRDYILLCSGHDVCRLLARALRHEFGSTNDFEGDKGLKKFGSVLRLSYQHTDFFRSTLYRCMRLWEARNEPFRIFSP